MQDVLLPNVTVQAGIQNNPMAFHWQRSFMASHWTCACSWPHATLHMRLTGSHWHPLFVPQVTLLVKALHPRPQAPLGSTTHVLSALQAALLL